MKNMSIQRVLSMLVFGVVLTAIFVLGIGWFQTSIHADGDTEIENGNLVLTPSRMGLNGAIKFKTDKGVLRSNLYILGTDLLVLSNKDGADKLRVDSTGKIFSNGTAQISSRSLKDNITNLSEADALTAFSKLQPVLFNYKEDTDRQAGFIAEDVPDVIAAPDHKSINPLEVTALLTSVVKSQQKQIQEMRHEIEALKSK